MRLAPLFAVCLLACGEPEDTTPEVQCEGDYDVFEPGFEVRSDQGNFYLQILEATPNPPDEGDNEWVVSLVSQSRTPVNGGVVVIEPWMPLHGHGISPPNYVGQASGDGEYTIPSFDLIMPGVWEFEALMTESMMNDTVTFSFCVEG